MEEVRYVVTAIYSPEAYSVCCNLIGVYRAKETAEDKVRKLELRGIDGYVHEIITGKEYPVEKRWNCVEGEIELCSYME